jgi:hypothetical protein
VTTPPIISCIGLIWISSGSHWSLDFQYYQILILMPNTYDMEELHTSSKLMRVIGFAITTGILIFYLFKSII